MISLIRFIENDDMAKASELLHNEPVYNNTDEGGQCAYGNFAMWNAAVMGHIDIVRVLLLDERVDDPAVLRLGISYEAALLAENGVVGIGLLQVKDNLPLSVDIDFGDEVVDAFGFDLKAM